MKKEVYYKVKKELAARAGLDARMRQEVDDCLMLSEKDIKMISMTVEEKLQFFSATPVTDDDIFKAEKELEDQGYDFSDDDDNVIEEPSSGAGEADSEDGYLEADAEMEVETEIEEEVEDGTN